MHEEADPCQRERDTESRIEERHEPRGHDTECAQGYATAHHDDHDDVALHIEELEDMHALFTIATNAVSVLSNQSGEHGVERKECERDADDEKPHRRRTF